VPWINEFHADNDGTDTGEYIEIAGIAGTSLAGYRLVLYNGNPNSRAVYNTRDLSGTITDQSNGYGTLSFAYPSNGIQNGGSGANGEPDGIALVDPSGNVVEFISYEGSFVALGGPADGRTSVNVGNGVYETGSEVGTSIGRVGNGNKAGDFTWARILDDTPGGVNAGQSFIAPSPQLSVADFTITEGNAGTALATFTVTRSAAAGAFSVNYATANGTATAGSDFVATAGTLNFAAGDTQKLVSVVIKGDAVTEANETFFLNLSNASNGATITDAQAVATITNDDGLPISVSINDAMVAEGDSGTVPLTFTVTRSGGTAAFSVDYITTGGTASVGSDYALASGRLKFAAGETSKTITVNVNGDTLSELNETFNVNLFNPTKGALLTDNSGTGTIINDEPTLIHDIQGSAYYSPILAAEGKTAFNQASTTTVTIRAIVTAVDGVGARQGFYITEEQSQWDDNPFSSEGIFVMTRNDSSVGSTLDVAASGLAVGDEVILNGHVMEYQAFQSQARTVITGMDNLSVLSGGNDLPIAFLDASHPIPNEILTGVTPDYTDSVDNAGDTFDGANYALSYYEGVEGMLVQMPDMVVADGFVSRSGGQPYFKAYSTVHANADQINSRGGYTIAGDPLVSPPNTPETTGDDVRSGGRYLHDGDVNPDMVELDFSDFATDAPAGLATQASMGDRLGDVYGVIDFDFTELKMFVSYIDETAIQNSQPERETTTIAKSATALTVATFNVENLDPTDGATRFAALADAIAKNLNAPDILSIEEIQDNNGAAAGDGISSTGTDASVTWTMLVNAVNAATGAKYQWVDQAPVYDAEGGEPSGNIRVGFLYNTERVQLGDLAPDASLAERRAFTDRIGDGVRDTGDRILYSDNMLGSEINTADLSNTRKSLLGQFTFDGETVFVAANHLPSKGGSGEFWQLDQNLSAGQPINNGWDKRAEIGQDLYSMLNLVQVRSPDAGVVAGGDFNDFYFYRPLEAATGFVNADGSVRNDGEKLTNLTLTLDEAERYTYDFDGRSQAIDHILVNQRLADVATYDVVHINTGYNALGIGDDADPSLSDHDPALASFEFGARGFSGSAASTPSEIYSPWHAMLASRNGDYDHFL
jgi:predicted extracellular nuclease